MNSDLKKGKRIREESDSEEEESYEGVESRKSNKRFKKRKYWGGVIGIGNHYFKLFAKIFKI